MIHCGIEMDTSSQQRRELMVAALHSHISEMTTGISIEINGIRLSGDILRNSYFNTAKNFLKDGSGGPK